MCSSLMLFGGVSFVPFVTAFFSEGFFSAGFSFSFVGVLGGSTLSLFFSFSAGFFSIFSCVFFVAASAEASVRATCIMGLPAEPYAPMDSPAAAHVDTDAQKSKLRLAWSEERAP